jgi:DNA (cytosine-5)-methyltransferase 1
MKILNLYACLGGNRYKWGDEHDITAVELDPEAARLYQERFPNDTVIIGDAHQYLLDHYKEYDFIWSSPPCPTHSRIQTGMKNIRKMAYPDMTLYQEIILLNNFYTGKYVVENVIPYYEPLIPAQKRGRHLYWANFKLPSILTTRKVIIGSGLNEVKKLCDFHDYDFYKYKGKQPTNKMARNLVDYEAGKKILDTVLGIIVKENVNQMALFYDQ